MASAQAKGTPGQLAAGKMMPLFDVNTTANTVTVGHTTFAVTSSTRFFDSDGNQIRMGELPTSPGGGPGNLVMATTESRAVSGGYELISLKLMRSIAD